jgi:hypothetical protein
VRSGRSKILLQFRDVRFLFLYLAGLFLDFVVLFEELVEQHVVDLLVVDGHNFTISAPHHELGIHLGDLLGDQTIVRRAFPVAVVFKGYWFELVQRFTGLVHRLNVVFELSRRRVEDAHVVKLIDKHWHLAAGVANRLAEDAADEAGVIEGSKRAVTRCADRDAVIDAWSQTAAGLVTDSDVRITVYVVIECVIADRCVKGARRVEKHGVIAHRIILVAGTIQERVAPVGIVEVSIVIKERKGAESIVVRAAVVMEERFSSNGRVHCSGGISVEGSKTSGRVGVGGVAIERSITVGGVVTADCVVGERISASGTIEKPAGVARER